MLAIRQWCEKRKIQLVSPPHHIYPRAYVMARVAPKCIIVSTPHVDAEPQVAEWNKKWPSHTVREFDDSLQSGDWCSLAYICSTGNQRTIAIPVVK